MALVEHLTVWLCVALVSYKVNAASTVNLSGKPEDVKAGFRLDVGKLIIDTDAGADDAVALLLALGLEDRIKGLQIMAITCVNGNTDVDNVVQNVLNTLDTAHRLDIPVFKGASKSLLVTPSHDFVFGANGFGDHVYRNPPSAVKHHQKKHAVNEMIDLVNKHPGEVTILCLGPLTNIALAIQMDPTFITKVQQLAVTGGSVEGVGNVLPGIDFNFYMDPDATFIVFNTSDTADKSVKPIVLFPWESAAIRHNIPLEWRVNVLGSVDTYKMRFLNAIEKSNSLKYDPWISVDALTTAAALNSSIIASTVRVYAMVATQGIAAGSLMVDYQKSLKMHPNAVIVQNVNLEVFKAMLEHNLG